MFFFKLIFTTIIDTFTRLNSKYNKERINHSHTNEDIAPKQVKGTRISKKNTHQKPSLTPLKYQISGDQNEEKKTRNYILNNKSMSKENVDDF